MMLNTRRSKCKKLALGTLSPSFKYGCYGCKSYFSSFVAGSGKNDKTDDLSILCIGATASKELRRKNTAIHHCQLLNANWHRVKHSKLLPSPWLNARKRPNRISFYWQMAENMLASKVRSNGLIFPFFPPESYRVRVLRASMHFLTG